ncbi:hypothetical protein GHV20_006520 [Klebsiella oxytoca]
MTPVSDLLVTDDVAGHTGPLTSGDRPTTPRRPERYRRGGLHGHDLDGDTVLGTVVAGEDGRWSYTLMHWMKAATA